MPKTVLISGGTKGIGKAAVIQLLEDGFNVATFSKNPDNCEALKNELKDKYGKDRFLIMSADITDETQLTGVVEETKSRFNSIDILINNAGFGYFEDSDKVDTDRFQNMVQTNLVGLALLTKHVELTGIHRSMLPQQDIVV